MTNIIKAIFDLKNSLNSSPDKQAPSKKPEKFDSYIEPLADELARCFGNRYGKKFSDFPTGKVIMALSPAEALSLVIYCVPRYIHHQSGSDDRSFARWLAYGEILESLLKKKLPFTIQDIIYIIREVIKSYNCNCCSNLVSAALRATEQMVVDIDLSEELRNLLISLAKTIQNSGYLEARESRNIERAILLSQQSKGAFIPLLSGEAWSDKAIADIRKMSLSEQKLWSSLLTHCVSTQSGQPTKGWLKKVTEKLHAIGIDNFYSTCSSWFALLGCPRTVSVSKNHESEPDRNLLLKENNACVFKGLVWCCSIHENTEIARILLKAGIISFKKIPGHGAKSSRIGHAVIYSLANMPGKTGLYQLAALKTKIKYRQALLQLESSLATAAEREGLSSDDVAEIGIPAYGLESIGYGEEIFNEYTALIQIKRFKGVELTWRSTNGKIQKSVPKSVKEQYEQQLKELRANIRDIKLTLSIQKHRIEQFYLRNLSWSFDIWVNRYLMHPIVGLFSQNLIWCFHQDGKTTLALYRNQQFETVTGEPITESLTDSRVQLWHPITSGAEEIKAWRERLKSLEITQPFKQAHREVYCLTEDEAKTEIYSNRYASHIIKQHQFKSLTETRGWDYKLQGAWDGDEVASISLDKYNVSAVFWVNGIGGRGEGVTYAGVFTCITTDQIRFYNLETEAGNTVNIATDEQLPLPLNKVPALVLSEVFRDVDLYISVCSVGNDPDWSDCANTEYRNYWHNFSFGQLSPSAVTRKEVLEGLIPILSFGSRCHFSDRYLIIQGKKCTYQIHIGSGKVLMGPQNRYLSIVTDQKKKAKEPNIYLPFEGDNTLSLILSKAALLANDDKIKDSDINKQIDTFLLKQT